MDDVVDLWAAELPGAEAYAAFLSISRAERTVMRTIKAVLQDRGLTVPQWTMLTVLHFAPDREMTVGNLAERIAVHPSTVTNAMDRLEPLGWIERRAPDRRTILARLTPDGTARLREIQLAIVETQFGMPGLDVDSLRAITASLGPVPGSTDRKPLIGERAS